MCLQNSTTVRLCAPSMKPMHSNAYPTRRNWWLLVSQRRQILAAGMVVAVILFIYLASGSEDSIHSKEVEIDASPTGMSPFSSERSMKEVLVENENLKGQLRDMKLVLESQRTALDTESAAQEIKRLKEVVQEQEEKIKAYADIHAQDSLAEKEYAERAAQLTACKSDLDGITEKYGDCAVDAKELKSRVQLLEQSVKKYEKQDCVPSTLDTSALVSELNAALKVDLPKDISEAIPLAVESFRSSMEKINGTVQKVQRTNKILEKRVEVLVKEAALRKSTNGTCESTATLLKKLSAFEDQLIAKEDGCKFERDSSGAAIKMEFVDLIAPFRGFRDISFMLDAEQKKVGFQLRTGPSFSEAAEILSAWTNLDTYTVCDLYRSTDRSRETDQSVALGKMSEFTVSEAKDKLEKFADHTQFMSLSLEYAAMTVKENSLDFLYIRPLNGGFGHYVMRALRAFWPKLKQGALIVGEHYQFSDKYFLRYSPDATPQVVRVGSYEEAVPAKEAFVANAVDVFAKQYHRQITQSVGDSKLWMMRK